MSKPKVMWVPLESNPEVFNIWADKAGLITSQDQFGDVFGLDPELLAMIPQPVKAVILCFPTDDKFKKQQAEQRAHQETQSIDPTVFWVKQTLGNACGSMAILHALSNTNVTFSPASPMAEFIEEAKGKSPSERVALLENASFFANIHNELANTGQTAPPPDKDTDHHYTCFVQAPSANARANNAPDGEMRVIELDGSRDGPIDHGPCPDGFLPAVAEIIKKYFFEPQPSNAVFNIIYLGRPPEF